YSTVDVWGFTPNRDFTITVLEGQVFIEDPLYDYLNQGESYTMSAESDEQTVRISSGSGNEARVKIEYVPTEVVNLYEQQAIVPAAVSSQLDVTGEERIHIAPYHEVVVPEPEVDCAELDISSTGGTNSIIQDSDLSNLPSWLVLGDPMEIRFYPDGEWSQYELDEHGRYELVEGETVFGEASGMEGRLR